MQPFPEFFTKGAVDHKIDGGIEADQEIGKNHRHVEVGAVVNQFQTIDDESGQITSNKGGNQEDQHGRDVHLGLLVLGQAGTIPVRSLDRQVDLGVQNGQQCQWNDVQDSQVNANVVDPVIYPIVPQLRRANDILDDGVLSRSHYLDLCKARQVVNDCQDGHGDEGPGRALPGREGESPQRMSDGKIPLSSDQTGRPYAARL